MDLSRYADDARFAYLRVEDLRRALFNEDRLLDSLVRDLKVEAKSAAMLKALPPAKKLEEIERALRYVAAAETSVFHGVPLPEVLAAFVFRSSMAGRIFRNVRKEKALRPPVTTWLQGEGFYVPPKEVPMSDCRVDVFGRRERGWLERAGTAAFRKGIFKEHATELVAVELKDNADKVMKHGFYQMATYRAYAHKVYLACTPYCAASMLEKHALGVGTTRWDSKALDVKLKDSGFGLLLVEGNKVYKHIEAPHRNPDATKIDEVELALKNKKMR